MPWFENRSGEHLWYEESGSGYPVVLLHGWCMSSVVWKYQFDGLGAFARLIAPDLRGHGRSREVSSGVDFHGFTNDLADLLDHLSLPHVILIGWSMGAHIALQASIELTNRLAGMVLVSATPCFTATNDFPYGLSPDETRGMRLKVQRHIQRALDGFITRLFAVNELEKCSYSFEIELLLSSIAAPETNAALEALDALSRADMRYLLDTIGLPVLIVNGMLDRICLPQASEYLKAHIPDAGHTVFPHAGHAPFLTQSIQFNDAINCFIRACRERNP